MSLSAPRGTLKLARGPRAYPVAAATKTFKGGIAVLSAGHVKPGSTAVNLIAAGMFSESVDNSAGTAGAQVAHVEEGTFLFDVAASDPVAQADVGGDVYIVDDETIAKTNGTNTRSRAGKLVGLSGGKAWVKIGLGV
jgi:hypothetical protein